MNTVMTKSAVIKHHSFNATRLLTIGSFSVFLFFIFTERALAEDFRDQQDRMRNEYYQQQDTQREMNRVRDHEELRQTQTNQAIKYREQDEQMKKASQRIHKRATPHEPEIISHDRGVINANPEGKDLKPRPEADQKQIQDMPKVNMDKLLDSN